MANLIRKKAKNEKSSVPEIHYLRNFYAVPFEINPNKILFDLGKNQKSTAVPQMPLVT